MLAQGINTGHKRWNYNYPYAGLKTRKTILIKVIGLLLCSAIS
jgi:hypothetical protein